MTLTISFTYTNSHIVAQQSTLLIKRRWIFYEHCLWSRVTMLLLLIMLRLGLGIISRSHLCDVIAN